MLQNLQKRKQEDLSDFKKELNISLGQIMETMKHSISSVPLSNDESERLSRVYS